MKKVDKGKCFVNVEEVKMAEALKDIKIDEFKNFSAMEKPSW